MATVTAPGMTTTASGAPLPLAALPQGELLCVDEAQIPLLENALGAGIHFKPLRLDLERNEWVLLVIAGQAIFFESRGFAIYGAVWFAFVHLFTTVYEEPTLRQSFGDAYDHYCRNVRRWIPGKRYTSC